MILNQCYYINNILVNFRTFSNVLGGWSQRLQQEREFFIMYGGNTEHTFYSLTPKLSPKAIQRIGKARSQLPMVPRLNEKISLSRLLLEIPEPNHRVQPKTQSRSTFRPFGFVSLRLLRTEKLLVVFEGIFYRPSLQIVSNNSFHRSTQNHR